jgi:hypothetical protein
MHWSKPGDFVLRSDLEQIYPRQNLWWLCGWPEFPEK